MNTGTELKDCKVTMSNKLVRASHALNLTEKRLITAAIAKVDSRKGNTVHTHLSDFHKVRITALDYAEAYGVDPKHAYNDLKSAADDLFNRQITITEYSKKGQERYTKMRWVGSIKYAKSEGFVELSFTPEVYPHLHMLKREYTTYRLKNAASLRSVYSWRLFEIARSWLDHCTTKKEPVRLTLEQLRGVLETPDSYKWKDIRVRAIEPAIKEISEKDSLKITYEAYKKGRAVAGIYLYVEENTQGKLF
jgi:plasmid replication initiation protein